MAVEESSLEAASTTRRSPEMPPIVLVTDHLTGDLTIEHEVLDPLGVDLRLASATDEDTLAAEAADSEAILVTYAHVTRRVIEAARRCRVIARYGIGVDNVDVSAASEAGIAVTNVPDYCLEEVADHTVALLLAVARQVTAAAAEVRAGGWGPIPGPVHRLRGRRLALVGVGGIGRRVAERVLPFGLEVIGFDPFVVNWDLIGVERADTLQAAVADADFISLHAPLTPENHHLIDADAIAAMRRAPIILNTARGGLVDLDALTAALEDGRIGGAGLDVTEPEPLPAGHPLRRHPLTVVTPHLGFYSVEAQTELLHRTTQETARALRGLEPDRPVNREALEVGRT